MTNRILDGLSAADLDLVAPHLQEVELQARLVLQRNGAACEALYFIDEGLLGKVAVAGRDQIEVALIGREGFVGMGPLLGSTSVLHETLVHVPGRARRLFIDDLHACMARSTTLREILLRFAYTVLAQVSCTALANGRNTVERRLARWLLMAHDRLPGSEIMLTHEFLALILGVRRPGVTVALHMLEGTRAIRSKRNSITVTDRKRLEEIAGSSYGVPEELYHRLMGSPIGLR